MLIIKAFGLAFLKNRGLQLHPLHPSKEATALARGHHLRHQIQTNERISTLWPIEKI